MMGSRAIYQDGWVAATFGPRIPWDPAASKLKGWDPRNDVWELYNVREDFSEAVDLAKENPEKLEELKEVFLVEATKNKVFPIGGSLYVVAYHPDQMKASTLNEWKLYEGMTRIPEAQSPKFQSGFSTHSTINANIPKNASGVLYAVGGIAAGFTVYMDKGELFAEYNAMTLNRYKVNSGGKIPVGEVKIEVIVQAKENKPMAPSDITLLVNGKEVGRVTAETTVPAIFTAAETFDVGMDTGSGVALEYNDRVPFKFNGKIEKVNIKYID